MDVKFSSGLTYLQNWLDSSDKEYLVNPKCQLYNDNKTEYKKSPIKTRNKNKKSSKLDYASLDFGLKMSPISEKRLPPLSKDNVKENISGARVLYERTYNKGPEILDFRDTWLQEIETYKDHMKSQQLLTQHNHVHTADGCFRDTPKDSIRNIEPIKRRIRTRSDSDPHDYKGRIHRDHDDELVLKRAREESYSPNNSNNHPNTPRNLSNGKNSTTPPLSTPKIIMNPYHASLLNPSQLDKNKINYSLNYNLPSTNASNNSNVSHKRHHKKCKSPPRVVDIATENVVLDSQPPQQLLQLTETVLDILSTDVTPIVPSVVSIVNNSSDNPNRISKSISNNDSGPTDDKSEDDASKFDDDEDDFGDIDDDGLYEPSSDSEDEYKGQVYLIDSDEELDTPETEITTVPSNTPEYITPKSPFAPSLFPLVPPYLTFSSHVEKGPQIHPELQKILKWKYSNIMPRIVKRVLMNSGFRLIKKRDNNSENVYSGSTEKDVEEVDEKGIEIV